MACYVYSKAEILCMMATWPTEKIRQAFIDTTLRSCRRLDEVERAFEAAAPEAFAAFADERAERNADRADAEWQAAGLDCRQRPVAHPAPVQRRFEFVEPAAGGAKARAAASGQEQDGG